MDYFSISQLSQFSGIKPHTIRIWEQRYNALKPVRSEGNTRIYDNNQLRRLLNIVSLSEENYKISELCSMPDVALFNLIKTLKLKKESPGTYEYFISQLMSAAIDLNENYLEQIFSNCLLHYGMKGTYTEVLCPLLIRMGLMWSTDTLPPAHEHYISNFIRQKLYCAINHLPPAQGDKYEWLLFLPENEFHETGLLFSHYLIRLSGRKSFYLGSNVPLSSAVAAARITRPSKILVYKVHRNLPEQITEYINELASLFKTKEIYIGGNEQILENISSNKKINPITSVSRLEQILLQPV